MLPGTTSHRTQSPFGQVRLLSVYSTAGQSPNRLRKNWKAMFPLEVRAFASIDPGRTIAGFRELNAADKASGEPFTSTSGFGDPPLRMETFPCESTVSVTVSTSVLKAQACGR